MPRTDRRAVDARCAAQDGPRAVGRRCARRVPGGSACAPSLRFWAGNGAGRFRSSAARRRARSMPPRSPCTRTISAAASRGSCAGGAASPSTDVYRADFATLSRHGMRFLASMVGAADAPEDAASMLDNAPLGSFLARAFDLVAAHRPRRKRCAVRAGGQRDQLLDRTRDHLLRRRSRARALATHPPSRRFARA